MRRYILLVLACCIAASDAEDPLLLSHRSGVSYRVAGFARLYAGQKIPGTDEAVPRLGWYETPVVAQSDYGKLLTDGSLEWGKSVRTHFWGNQEKRIEATFDLGAVYQIDKVEAWAAGGRQGGNFIQTCTTYYGTEDASHDRWDGHVAVKNPHKGDRSDPVEYPIAAGGIGKPARFVRVVCYSNTAMMVLGEVKIWGRPTSAVEPRPAPEGTVRFEAESIEGAVCHRGDRYLGGAAVWVGGAQAAFALPSEGPYVPWIRYLDNGQRTLQATLNGESTRLPAQPPRKLWRWHRLREIRGPKVELALRGVGAHASSVDSIVFTPSVAFDPNQIAEHSRLTGIAQVLPPLGFAKRLLRERGDKLSVDEWADTVRRHYGYPEPLATPAALIDKCGSILLDGKPYFQLGLFHSNACDPRLRDVAVNTFMNYPTDDDPRDLAVVRGYSSQWRAYDKIAESLKTAANDPRVLMHYICDEPENVGVTAEELRRLNALVKALDPTKPTFVNVSGNMAGNRPTLTVSDIVGLDQYPIPGGRIADIGYNIDLMRVNSGGRPVVFIAQSFSWAGYGRAGGRFPTPHEVRAMAYLALVHNARGLWFYEFPAPKMSSKTCIGDVEPELWADMQTLLKEIRTITPALLGPEVNPPFEVASEGEGFKLPELRVAVAADRSVAYLIAVHPWHAPAEVDVAFGVGLADAGLTPAFEPRGVALQRKGRGRFRFAFSPAASGVFRLESAHLDRLAVLPKERALAKLHERITHRPDRPRAEVPLVGAPDSAWDKALDLLDTWASANRPDSARVLASKDSLHLRVVTRFPKGTRSKHLKRDGAVWADPCIEVFIGNQKSGRYVQLAVNTANVQFDQAVDPSKPDQTDLSADWEWASRVDAGAELADYTVTIPWNSLKQMADLVPGDKAIFNLASTKSRWDWAGLTGGGFHIPSRFGVLALPRVE